MTAVAHPVAAQEAASPRPAQLEVDTSSPCARRSDLVARVRARLPGARFVDTGGVVVVVARFTAERDGAIVAEVAFTGADATESTRRVVTRSCSEATDAAALIIAMTLSPASLGSVDASIDASAAEPAKVGEGAASTARPAVEPPLRKSVVPDEGDARRGEGANRPPSATSFGVLLAAQSFVGPGPAVLPGVALYTSFGAERDTLWSPAVLVGVTHAGRSTLHAGGGRASFTLNAATLDACPVYLRLGPVRARPCGALLIGRLGASGAETSNAADSERPFSVMGGAAIASVGLFWLFEASARVAIGANLVRDSFEFTPNVFHTVPALTVAASAGIGLRWR